MSDTKMINKMVPSSVIYNLKQIGIQENKKMYELTEEILNYFINNHKKILEQEEEPLQGLSVRINKETANTFAKLSKKMGIRQDKLISQAINEYVQDNEIELINIPKKHL